MMVMVMKHKRTFGLDTVQAFKIFHAVFVLVILIASLKTVVEALGASNHALFALASVEAIAAVFFVFPKFTKGAGIVLLAIFLLVSSISLITGSLIANIHLLLYFACTLFIVVHGNVWKSSNVDTAQA